MRRVALLILFCFSDNLEYHYGKTLKTSYVNRCKMSVINRYLLISQPRVSIYVQEDFNSWNFWRVPVPDIDL
jgi:hypothetical protein